ncbi:unnamed protein product [Caenorhabditis angaria]|uniref:Uncharacterized protein n=1 Tax=Caenorhabditis angaria TaxID=860376 RepID=A0A9P1MUI5_9PELO|nr:unnamed protein product [Caenorhabditis angaria]
MSENMSEDGKRNINGQSEKNFDDRYRNYEKMCQERRELEKKQSILMKKTRLMVEELENKQLKQKRLLEKVKASEKLKKAQKS